MLQDDVTYERVGNTWVFADGTVLPVVSGAEGEVTGGDAGGAPAAGDAGTGAPADAGAEGGDPFESGADSFPRAYVEKLRQESANYRTKAQQYEEAFGQYDDQDRTTWLDLAKTVYQDPAKGAQWLKDIAKGLEAGLTEEQAVAAAGQEPATQGDQGADKAMTRAEMEQFYKDQRAAEQKAADEAATLKGITDELTGLGYKEGTMEWNNALWLASRPTEQGGTAGDLKAAHAALEAAKQQIIDQYVEAQRANGGRPSALSSGVPAAGGEAVQIKSLADSHAAAKARIEAILAGGVK